MKPITRAVVILLLLSLCVFRAGAEEGAGEAIPEPMPLVDEGDQDIVNILLIGAATTNPYNPGLTDSLMVISVNRTAGAVSVVSIPRDLYVLLPGYTMQKINTAYYYGEVNGAEGGGYGLLRETIRYNLGLNIDFYVRVNFLGFMDIIDAVGGIDITVDCVIRDWKLISWDMDKQDPASYEMFTMGVGRWHMDSELALWYVRSRKTSSDLDRGRRQQDVMRALWRKIRATNMLEHLPETWETFTESVSTNLTLSDVLGMAPLALQIETSDIRYFTFRQKHEVRNAVSPAKQDVLVPIRDGVIALMQNVVLPPSASQIKPYRPTVAIVNASGVETLDLVAADRLELEGFRTRVLTEGRVQPRNFNHIIDYTGATKGSPIGVLQRVLRVTAEGVEIKPDPNRAYDFKVYIGAMYQYWACTRNVIQPKPDEVASG